MVRPPLQVDGLQGRSYHKQRELIFRDNQQQKEVSKWIRNLSIKNLSWFRRDSNPGPTP